MKLSIDLIPTDLLSDPIHWRDDLTCWLGSISNDSGMVANIYYKDCCNPYTDKPLCVVYEVEYNKPIYKYTRSYAHGTFQTLGEAIGAACSILSIPLHS